MVVVVVVAVVVMDASARAVWTAVREISAGEVEYMLPTVCPFCAVCQEGCRRHDATPHLPVVPV